MACDLIRELAEAVGIEAGDYCLDRRLEGGYFDDLKAGFAPQTDVVGVLRNNREQVCLFGKVRCQFEADRAARAVPS